MKKVHSTINVAPLEIIYWLAFIQRWLCCGSKQFVLHIYFLFPFSWVFWDRILLLCFFASFHFLSTIIIFYSISLVQVKPLKKHSFVCSVRYKMICLKISFSSCHSALLWCRWENAFWNILKRSFKLDAME